MEKISWGNRVTIEVLRKIKKERNILHTIQRRKADWICHILLRNCLLRHVTEGKQKVDNSNDGKTRKNR